MAEKMKVVSPTTVAPFSYSISFRIFAKTYLRFAGRFSATENYSNATENYS